MRNFIFACLGSLGLIFCCCEDEKTSLTDDESKIILTASDSCINTLLTTSCINVTTERINALRMMQDDFNICSAKYFGDYMVALEKSAASYEKYDPSLKYYKKAFDKVLKEIDTTSVAQGGVILWNLYNMGYVIKTPSSCFAIDLRHKYAVYLEPYLDFLMITHKHSDHYSTELIDAMVKNNKPVITNYLAKNIYTSTIPTTYTFTFVNKNTIRITTNINDHNTTLINFVTTFQINCGADAGNCIIMHTGDSSFNPSQYNVIQDVNVFITRYAPNGNENNILGSIVKPDCAIVSHIDELSHTDESASRWSFQSGLERCKQLQKYCPCYMPVWGEKMVWTAKTGLTK